MLWRRWISALYVGVVVIIVRRRFSFTSFNMGGNEAIGAIRKVARLRCRPLEHEHMLAIYFMYYNFYRVHQTLRVTPAMEAGISDYVWGVDELVKLIEPKSFLDGLKRTA